MMKHYIFILIMSASFASMGQMKQGKVISVLDGDTIIVLDSDNNQTKLRLAEIDCPEKSQPYGKNAKNFTSDAVYNKNISYKAVNTDKYGRTIAMVYFGVNLEYLSAELLKNGLAWHYKKYSPSGVMADFEIKARRERKGLWSIPDPVAPWNWRKTRRIIKNNGSFSLQVRTPVKSKPRRSYRKVLILKK